MEQTEQNTVMILTKVEAAFGSLPGYPRDIPQSLPPYAKQVLRIVHGETIKQVWERQWRRAQGKNIPCPECEYAPGDMMDYDFLIQEALSACQRFPTITQLREIYDRYFTAAEGREKWAQTYDLLYNKD
jgi:hypothetical protein